MLLYGEDPKKTSLITRFLRDVFWGKLDYLIIDTPPGTSDEHMTTVMALKDVIRDLDGAIMVTTPQDLSLLTVRKELKFCAKMHLPILGVVENMSGFVCPCCNTVTEIFKNGGGEKMAQQFNLKFLGAVPLDARIGLSGESGAPIFEKYKDSPSIVAFLNIVDKIIATSS